GTELHLHLEESLIPSFFQLLQKGFRVKIQAGCSVKSFLCEQLGLSPEYVEKRIQTLFLDGKPVDDKDSATIRDGSTLALSAAMPGLVGAVLRSGGFFASMRSTISYREEEKVERPQQGMVSLKLFNILLREIGPAFLERGIWIRGKDLQNFIEGHSDDFWAGCKKATVDGKEWDLKKLSRIKWAAKDVFLRLKVN
ncbi:MAG: hypothetical protein PVI53_16690, partial [Desulfobacteraceae bacterium]